MNLNALKTLGQHRADEIYELHQQETRLLQAMDRLLTLDPKREYTVGDILAKMKHTKVVLKHMV